MSITVTPYHADDFLQVDSLWEEAFPDSPAWNRAAEAIPAKLAIQPELLLVARDGDTVIGTVMAGYDGHRGWLYAVAVARSHRRRGIGRLLVQDAETRLGSLGCNKINLQERRSNDGVIGFYEALGYGVEDRIGMGKRIAS